MGSVGGEGTEEELVEKERVWGGVCDEDEEVLSRIHGEIYEDCGVNGK